MFIPGYELSVTIECRCLSSLISDIVGYNMLDPIEHPISWVWIMLDQVYSKGVSWCCGNHCWFSLVLLCGYCSVSF